MKYSARHIAGNSFQINLITESAEERAILEKSTQENIQPYFHLAVQKSLGASANLVEILDQSLLPYSVIGKVLFARGIGGV